MIVDGNALLHRAWHAIPLLQTKKGEVVNAVYGFATIFLKALKDLAPTHTAVAFDTPAPTFRHTEFIAYKAQREKKPEELYQQIGRIKEFLSGLGVQTFQKEGYEADDVIATVVASLRRNYPDTDIIIVTGDMDALQLVDEKTNVYTLKRGITDTIIYDQKAVAERFGGLMPKQLREVKALRGDPSDNIPGVRGIGEKGAVDLVKQFGTIEDLYRQLENVDDLIKKKLISKRLAEILLSHKEDAFLSHRLVTLVYDLDIGFDFSACERRQGDRERLVALFQELDFKSLLPRIQELSDSPNRSLSQDHKPYTLLVQERDILDLCARMRRSPMCAIDTETTSLNTLDSELLGISISIKNGEAYYIPWNNKGREWKKELIAILEDPAVLKVAHNGKYDMGVFANEGITLAGLVFDTMLAAYLINPGTRSYSLDALSFSEFGYQKIPITALIGTGKHQISMRDVAVEKLSVYACEDADFTFRLYEKYAKELVGLNQVKLLSDIEAPLIPVLVAMERAGVKIDLGRLVLLSKEVSDMRTGHATQIYSLAGEEFNINSPIQLKKVLFEKLAIVPPKLKKGKTGISTAASELEKMQGLHPIMDHILSYRELTKLLNTYIDVLPTLVHPKTGRIHTSFNQTIAATGRLSSSNPNLQNIPIKQALGRKIRSCFIGEQGTTLVAADYSQVELRIIASLAKDKKMIRAFHEGIDIHTATAAEMNGVPLEEVTKEMRRAAKEVNFGVLYGMGPQGLSVAAGISYVAAAQFIERYFAAYPQIQEYIETTIALARANGYSETFFGRRRYLPDLQAGMQQLRAAAERAAINMPIQGTAADIMKLAMIRIHEKIRHRDDARMILQVHDELVFEVKEESLPILAPLIQEEMESVVKLDVSLVVDVKYGKNWEDMKSIS